MIYVETVSQKMLKRWFDPVKQIFLRFERNNHVLDAIDNKMHRIFFNRGSKVLFVAHVDTVRTPRLHKSDGRYIRGRGFDDRLGCMLAYNLSKELNADLLLTDHEERGGTTAKYHKIKDYNWIVEFDRESTDIVTYGLDSPEFKQALMGFWNIGFGSYSDICDIKTDACCFNLGLGHYNSHGKKSFVCIRETEQQIKKFREFYAMNKDIKYTQQYSFTERDAVCEFCEQQYGIEVFDTVVCNDCFEMMVENYYSAGNFGELRT